jgi:proteic killer suppression protein
VDVVHKDDVLRQVEIDANTDCGHGEAATNGFRKRMQSIRAALDERDFYAQKSLHFEKLQGKRDHQRSMRINNQWRLIVEIVGEVPNKKIWVIGIEDYHH